MRPFPLRSAVLVAPFLAAPFHAVALRAVVLPAAPLSAAAILAAALLAVSPGASAQAQPAIPKLVRIVVPFAAGGSNDVIARAVAAQLGKRLETSVIVENKPGATGVIGSEFVAKAPRDGSTLLLTSSTFTTAAATKSQLPYDPVGAFAPVAMIGQGPLLLAVSPSSPFKSTGDVIAAARAKPSGLTYGTAGVGSVGHLAHELLNDSAKVQMVHVPYKGAAPAVLDLAGGQIQLMLSSQSTLAPMIRAGKVKALAVTSKEAHRAFPDLPPLAATVPDYAIDIWVGVFAPSGTPAPLVERLNREINGIAATPELGTILEPEGTVPTPISPAAFAAKVKDELAQWKRIAAERKIVAE